MGGFILMEIFFGGFSYKLCVQESCGGVGMVKSKKKMDDLCRDKIGSVGV